MLFNLHPLLRPAIMYYLFLFITYEIQVKFDAKKISPITGPRCSEGSRELRFPDYVTLGQDGGKVSLKHRALLPPGNTPGTHFR